MTMLVCILDYCRRKLWVLIITIKWELISVASPFQPVLSVSSLVCVFLTLRCVATLVYNCLKKMKGQAEKLMSELHIINHCKDLVNENHK
ncbi:hypothetical protein GDO86_020576 [Hymenochirus boettgeri]|uniref:Uncharacterized protein n=1 Tax=Hymenochirus boettgeri TaxID=247094 RepID=A0A8T2IG72_9PIPI|nr:hypothetical protein GDO86_020576 [Hymenochirus boettgeri]